MPALNRAFDHFWANDAGPGACGLVDRYAAAWKHFAARFEVDAGLDGLRPDERAVAGQRLAELHQHRGLPGFDSGPLSRVHPEDDRGDPRGGPARTSPGTSRSLTFDFGADTSHGDPEDPQRRIQLPRLLPRPARWAAPTGEDCETFEELAVRQRRRAAREETEDALLLSEFGATDDLVTLERVGVRISTGAWIQLCVHFGPRAAAADLP